MTCVYRHIRPDKNEVFYVGIGNVERPYSKKSRNKIWHFIVNKNNGIYKTEVLATNLSRAKAVELEDLLIEEYGRKCDADGPLANIEKGYGKSAFITKKKISSSVKGFKMPRSMKEKTRRRMIGNNYGFKKGNAAHNSIPVRLCIDGVCNDYSSIEEATKNAPVCRTTLEKRLKTQKYKKSENFTIKPNNN